MGTKRIHVGRDGGMGTSVQCRRYIQEIGIGKCRYRGIYKCRYRGIYKCLYRGIYKCRYRVIYKCPYRGIYKYRWGFINVEVNLQMTGCKCRRGFTNASVLFRKCLHFVLHYFLILTQTARDLSCRGRCKHTGTNIDTNDRLTPLSRMRSAG